MPEPPSVAGVDQPAAEAAPAPPAARGAEPDSAPVPPPAPTPAPAPAPPRRGGFGAPLLGGVLAAAVGAGAVLVLLPEGRHGLAGRGDGDLARIESRLAALEGARPDADVADLRARLATLEAGAADAGAEPAGQAPDLAPLESRIAALESAATAGLADLEARLAALEARPEPPTVDPATIEARLADLENRPQPAPPDLGPLESAIVGLAARLSALEAALPGAVAEAVETATAGARAELEAQAEAVAASAEEIAAAETRAAALAALGELGLAAESGGPAPEALDRLAAAGLPTDDLAPFAAGLPTLAALQASYAAAARAALAAAPVPDDAGPADRVLNFLRAQTGARSLAPRAGDDTDAILSRAEAAVRRGDLPAALGELDALPAGPAAAMAAWRNRAETRLAALAALNAAAARLGQQ